MKLSQLAFFVAWFITAAVPAESPWVSVTITAQVECFPSGVEKLQRYVDFKSKISTTKGAYFHYRMRLSDGTVSKDKYWSKDGPATAPFAFTSTDKAPASGWGAIEAAPWPPVPADAGYKPSPPGPHTKWTIISDQATFSGPCLSSKPSPP